MKNLKKVLALALAFAMSLTLFAGAAFTDDASIGIDYQDDVSMLVQLGIIGGYADGSFKPQGTITRAETTKLIYVLNYGYDDAGKLFSGAPCEFTDVAANADWAKGYINYCYNQGIVGGVGNKKFNPNGKVTVAELAKMLLVSLGADAIKEGYGGPNWASNVTADAMELGVFDGWTGDPTQPASRELACKLMRNTIFAPSYQYNAITGIGSQINALDGKTENETLGEKKMGLKHVEGLVVSNARYELPIDGEGIEIDGLGSSVSAQKDRSQIYYEIDKASDSDYIGEMAILDIKVDLPDTMLGNVVDVYFKGDAASSGTYSKVELIGDVLVNSKTVAHDVMSSDIEIMPNGQSNSSKDMKPYISFTTADGQEEKVVGRTDYVGGIEANDVPNGSARVPSNVEYDGAIFAHRMFFTTATAPGADQGGVFFQPELDADGNLVAGAGKTILDKIGTKKKANRSVAQHELARYRFVSVDGGDTYSYIFRLGNMMYTKVNSITDSTITLANGIGVKDLEEEAVVIGDVSKGAPVVAYAQDGKVYVEATKIVSGKATNFRNNTATIAGATYCAAYGIFGNGSNEIDDYFVDDTSLNNESASYVTYKNYVLEVDTEAAVAGATDYAVILYSDYDQDTGVITVKLAFADNTVGTYEVSRIASNDTTDESLKTLFANNLQMGALVRTSISNGRVSLTANSTDIWSEKAGSGDAGIHNQATEGADANKNDARAYVEDGKFYFNKVAHFDTGNSVIFMIYGGALYNGVYGSINAKAYKLANIGDAAGMPAPVYVKIGTEAAPATDFKPFYIGDVVDSTNSNGMKTVIAGVMSVGEHASAGNADPESIAYILNAEYNYNTETDKWYLEVDMITKDGLVSTRTIDEANNGSAVWNPSTGETVGSEAIPAGSLAIYEMCAAEDGSDAEWIMSLETNGGKGLQSAMVTAGASIGNAPADGYYAVQIGVVADDQIGLFPNSHEQDENTTKENWSNGMITLDVDKYRFDVVAIDDVTFIEDGDIETISYSDEVEAGEYNAIIVVDDKEIIRVFSLYNNF